MEVKRDAASNQEEKRAAGEAAANLVRPGMVVGLGTGSTVAWTIRRIGEMVREGLEVLGVPTSYQSESLALSVGIRLTTLAQNPLLDLAIDGADQIDSRLMAIKGGGAAHTREKVVARSARRFILVSDSFKLVDRLDVPVPLEVLPFAVPLVERQVGLLGGMPVLRQAKMKDGPVITDNGNMVIDADFGVIEDPVALSQDLSGITGVVEHGLFTGVDGLYIARGFSVKLIEKPL